MRSTDRVHVEYPTKPRESPHAAELYSVCPMSALRTQAVPEGTLEPRSQYSTGTLRVLYGYSKGTLGVA